MASKASSEEVPLLIWNRADKRELVDTGGHDYPVVSGLACPQEAFESLTA